jgi:predicted site-specific integrase-resolvase
MTPLTYSRDMASAALGVSKWVLDRYIADGLIPVVELPSTKRRGERTRRVLIAVADLEEFVNKYRGTPNGSR